MYVGYKKTFDTHVLHQVYDRIILHFSRCGTHYEPSLRSTVFHDSLGLKRAAPATMTTSGLEVLEKSRSGTGPSDTVPRKRIFVYWK